MKLEQRFVFNVEKYVRSNTPPDSYDLWKFMRIYQIVSEQFYSVVFSSPFLAQNVPRLVGNVRACSYR